MSSKVFLHLALIAIVLFLSSKVVARDLAETETTTQAIDVTKATTIETNGVHDAKYGGYSGGGYGGGGYSGGGYGGGGYGGGGYRGHCSYGRCCRYRHCRCCAYAGEAIEAGPKN